MEKRMKSAHELTGNIYLCRRDTFGANGNLKRMVQANITPQVARAYFLGFVCKYWRELLGIK